jgi:predicted RNase H-like HicB family nuclease
LNDRRYKSQIPIVGDNDPMSPLKIIIEKHPDGYVAYPLGVKGVIVGEGNTYEEALADVKSAIKFHIETFGKEAFETDEILETFIAEVAL